MVKKTIGKRTFNTFKTSANPGKSDLIPIRFVNQMFQNNDFPL